jgi:hypothetical protein
VPVLLRPEYNGEWLNPDVHAGGRLAAMLTLHPAGEMEATAADPFVNDA